jgi:hypothetical protein
MGPVVSIALASVTDARARLAEARQGIALIALAALFGLSAWVMVMSTAVLGLARLTGDLLWSLTLVALALGLVTGLVLVSGSLLRRKARKARQARQARQALALTTALALMPSGRSRSVATLALVAAGIGFALWRGKQG